jgi:hypothetical protein
MQATIELPKAFSVGDDRELPLIQDLKRKGVEKLAKRRNFKTGASEDPSSAKVDHFFSLAGASPLAGSENAPPKNFLLAHKRL